MDADDEAAPAWVAVEGGGPEGPWSATDVDVRRAMRACLDADATAAVATVAAVEGSAYRRPGARMVVDEKGNHLGAVTAGCLEEPVIELAEAVMATAEPTVETFDLTDDGEWGYGLGCNGVITLLVEPLDPSWRAALDALEGGDLVGMATALDATNHAFADADGAVSRGARRVLLGDPDDPEALAASAHWTDRDPLPDEAADQLAEAIASARSAGRTTVETVEVDGDSLRVLVDGLAPPPHLLLFGAQPDVHPVSRLARQVGFQVTVASPRGAHADAERFPAAHDVIASRPADLDAHVDGRTHVVCMSHSFADDQLALETLVGTDVPYIGLMGPRDRYEELLEAIDDEAEAAVNAAAHRLAAPVGLDIGADAPPEIALSIIGEVLAVANGRDGGRLRDAGHPIHTRADPDG